MYLHICNFTVDIGRDDSWTESRRFAGRTLPSKCRATTDTRKEMVHGTSRNNNARWNSSIWIDLHRNVLYLHVLLGLQDLLRLRFYVTRFCYTDDRHRLRDNRVHIFSSQCRRLQMVRKKI